MLNSKEYALQYFDEKDDSLFALITPAQWLEFANQYGMYVSQNSGNTPVRRSLPPGIDVDFFENVECEVEGHPKLMHEYRILVEPSSQEHNFMEVLVGGNDD